MFDSRINMLLEKNKTLASELSSFIDLANAKYYIVKFVIINKDNSTNEIEFKIKENSYLVEPNLPVDENNHFSG